MLKKRGIRALIITLLVALSASCFSLMFANLVSVFSSTKNAELPSATGAYSFDDIPFDQDGDGADSEDDIKNRLQTFRNSVYSNYSIFTIGSQGAWITFSMVACGYDAYYNGVIIENALNFDGKTVELTSDIKLTENHEYYNRYGWGSIYEFAGTFDGKGFTIENTALSSGTEVKVDGSDYHVLGLFGINSGEISNVRLLNTEVYIDSSDADSRAGTIVGYNDNTGWIRSCIVENVKFLSARFKSNCEVGSIAGINKGTIKNIIVDGKYEIGGKDGNGILNQDGMYACWHCADGSEPTNSLFIANVSTFGDYTEECKTPSETEPDVIKSNYQTADKASEGLANKGVISDSCGAGGKAWYQYNSGCGYNGDTSLTVYLRAFITWKTYSFSSNNASYGTVSHSSVTAPTGYHSVTNSGNNKVVYGTTVTPTAKDNCKFSNWSGNEESGFVANFEQSLITLTFSAIEGTKVNGNIIKEPITYTLNPGISVSVTRSADGSKLTYTFNSTSIVYTLIDAGNYFTTGNTTEYCSSEKTFTPTFAPKKFGIEFK